MTTRIHYLQHVPFEGPGCIEDWALDKGLLISSSHLYRQCSFPGLDEIDWLVIMGGPMGIHDEDKHHWLAAEKDYIRQAIEAGKTVLGICLGAQLIAHVLGARVYPNSHKEIGWFPVTKLADTDKTAIADCVPPQMMAFHWHGDTFDCPSGATQLMRSEACEQQAFVYNNRVIALQFHLETTRTGVENLIEHCGHELTAGDYIQSATTILQQDQYFETMNLQMARLLEALLTASARL